MTDQPKAGYLTTEFWLAVLATVAATVLLALHRITPAEWTTITGGSSGLYSLVRGVVKYGATPSTVTVRPAPAVASSPAPAVVPGTSTPGAAAATASLPETGVATGGNAPRLA